MFARDVRTPEKAVVYLVECTLATVTRLAMKKSRSVGEYDRQIAIAQKGIDWMIQMDIDPLKTRAAEVIQSYDGSVKAWAKFYDVKREENR